MRSQSTVFSCPSHGLSDFLVRLLLCVLMTLGGGQAIAGAKEDITADLRAGRWEQADKRLNTVLAKHPTNALAHYWRAQARLQMGDLESAQQSLLEAKRLDPSGAFSGDARKLRDFEAKLGMAPAPAQKPVPVVDHVAVDPSDGRADDRPIPPAPPATNVPIPAATAAAAAVASLAGFVFWVPLVGILVMGVALLYRSAVNRSDPEAAIAPSGADRKARVERLCAQLDAALAKSDADPHRPPETKLQTYDNIKLLKARLRAAVDSSDRHEDLAQIEVEALDLVATVDGTELHSVKLKRKAQEAQDRADEERRHQRELEALRAARPVHVSQSASAAPSVPIGGLAVGGLLGVLAASAMAGHSSGSDRARSSSGSSDSLDLGGSWSGSSSDTSSSLDLGGSSSSDSSSSSSSSWD